MAFNNNNNGRSGRTQTALAEINVTPLVDVMLVLLVIFMITAPILQTGIQVNLPKTREPQPKEATPEALIISVDKEGSVYLSGKNEQQAINVSDLPMVQTIVFMFAILVVLFNLIADVLYGLLDPRIRYD